MRMLRLIGFDGDDTLWHSEDYYRQANDSFAAIVGRYVDLADAEDVLRAAQEILVLLGARRPE